MEEQIINGLTVRRKSLFHSYEIFNEYGAWMNTYRDFCDVEKFCKNPLKEFTRVGDYEEEEPPK